MHVKDSVEIQRAGADANGFLLAIDFGGTKIAMATTTPAGERLHEAEIPTLAEQGAQTVMRRMFEAARALISKTLAGMERRLLAVAAVTPGIIEPDGIRLAPNNPGWDQLALYDELRAGFATHCVTVETDVKAAALAEARCGALAGIDCGLYLNLGTGLAAAAVIDGRVLRGANGAAGEIGYQLRGVPDDVLFADGGASLENFVSGRAIGVRVSGLLGRDVSAREAFALQDSVPQVAALIKDAFEALARHVANLTLMLDPSRIVIGGGMARIPGITDGIRSLLARAVPYPPEVAIAAFGHGAALQGAIVAASDAWALRRSEVAYGTVSVDAPAARVTAAFT
ncbi:glucokinase [Paraburkholderia sp. BL23I1N1]|uniref:ROK family protein n=1 Tax=Paraburkholderia sp. BL23I1N1 TaxID=1938802 RepID=UPI000E745BE2|nr:ROK family protein [Paraburkholderia sp. BL23I1N1]RKE39920.1 glucokinase [Paraburkholderia sp. BL23I1N1]